MLTLGSSCLPLKAWARGQEIKIPLPLLLCFSCSLTSDTGRTVMYGSAMAWHRRFHASLIRVRFRATSPVNSGDQRFHNRVMIRLDLQLRPELNIMKPEACARVQPQNHVFFSLFAVERFITSPHKNLILSYMSNICFTSTCRCYYFYFLMSGSLLCSFNCYS